MSKDLNTFNASELENVLTIIKNYKTSVQSVFNDNINSYSELSSIVKSEDSSLSVSCSKISKTYSKILNTFENKMDGIIKLFESYIQSTVKNETLSSRNLSGINEEISSKIDLTNNVEKL